jgi:signal transduction histidine kinase/DNA-binding NarL/FixJ family response regulator
VRLGRILAALTPTSLTGRTLVRIGLGVTLVILVAAATSYFLMFNEIERRSRKELADYVTHRVKEESEVFTLARDVQRIIVKLALERYPRYQTPAMRARFDDIYFRREDGSIRVRPETYTRESPTTGWLHRDTPVTDELKGRMVLFYDLVEQFKPALGVRLEDMYFTAPEQFNVGTDPPGLALWGATIPADFDQNSESWVKLATPAANASRATVYMGAELDPVWNMLVSGIATPIDLGGRHIGTMYNDVLISTLVKNLRRSGIRGAEHYLFVNDGRLIANSDRDEVVVNDAGMRLQEAREPRLRALWSVAQRQPQLPYVGHDEATDQYLALGRIEGPGWYLATTIPASLVRDQAFTAAQWVLWIGLGSLALLLVLLTMVIRRNVARPLRALTSAAERMASGNFRQLIRPAPSDELTLLANAFNDMMHRIGERDAALLREKQDLQEALAQLRRNEVEIQRQQAALIQKEKLAAMGSLLAGVAHELNNPLFVVSGRSQMLEASAAGTMHAVAARKIRAAAERCVRIVKTFLAMARQDRPRYRCVCIAEVVRSCIDVLDYTLQGAGVRVEIEREPQLPAVRGDVDQLHQVLMNLFVNAQQAMSDIAGPRVLRVRMRRRVETGQVEIRVSDSGPGVPAEIRARIFDPYFTTKPQGVGTGVGLSVCLGIVQAHGGSLLLEDVAGGATFVVTLPEATREESESQAPEGSATIVTRRVLIVDDEPDVRDTLREMLTRAGHEVQACESGEEALQWLAAEPYDAILSDLRMPDMDGASLYAEIRARWPDRAARVVFMTGDGLNEAHAQFLAGLAQPCMEKPFTPEDVCAVVALICGDEVRAPAAARTEEAHRVDLSSGSPQPGAICRMPLRHE